MKEINPGTEIGTYSLSTQSGVEKCINYFKKNTVPPSLCLNLMECRIDYEQVAKLLMYLFNHGCKELRIRTQLIFQDSNTYRATFFRDLDIWSNEKVDVSRIGEYLDNFCRSRSISIEIVGDKIEPTIQRELIHGRE